MMRQAELRLHIRVQITRSKTSAQRLDVQVDQYIVPQFTTLPVFLAHFQQRYDFKHLSGIQKIIATAASHHRLAWIHPFLDGNGRVARLFTVAAFKQLNLEAQYLLRDILLRGEVARGEVSRITGLKERTARTLTSELLQANLLQSTSSRAPLRIKIPVAVGAYYFPNLY